MNEDSIADYDSLYNDIPIYLRITKDGFCQWMSNAPNDPWWNVWYRYPSSIHNHELCYKSSTPTHHIFKITPGDFDEKIQFIRLPKFYFKKPSRHREIEKMIQDME
jgi:hypothetical protein